MIGQGTVPHASGYPYALFAGVLSALQRPTLHTEPLRIVCTCAQNTCNLTDRNPLSRVRTVCVLLPNTSLWT